MSLFPSQRVFATYGDGLGNINLQELINFHEKNHVLATVTAVRPPARFGVLSINGSLVDHFGEKEHTDSGWINGGFFVMEPEFLDLIQSDETVLEKEPLETVSNKSQLAAFQHDGFWQCMDTIRDRNILEDLWNSNKAPWKK
jgi:glucose-1-phosphate cytidylyltransferase